LGGEYNYKLSKTLQQTNKTKKQTNKQFNGRALVGLCLCCKLKKKEKRKKEK